MAENENDLQCQYYRFQTTTEKLNIIISIENTESMVISRNAIRGKLAVNEQLITQSI